MNGLNGIIKCFFLKLSFRHSIKIRSFFLRSGSGFINVRMSFSLPLSNYLCKRQKRSLTRGEKVWFILKLKFSSGCFIECYVIKCPFFDYDPKISPYIY